MYFPVDFCEILKNISFNWPPSVAASFRRKMQNIKKNTKAATCYLLFVWW